MSQATIAAIFLAVSFSGLAIFMIATDIRKSAKPICRTHILTISDSSGTQWRRVSGYVATMTAPNGDVVTATLSEDTN